jgi:hypothetical protein
VTISPANSPFFEGQILAFSLAIYLPEISKKMKAPKNLKN